MAAMAMARRKERGNGTNRIEAQYGTYSQLAGSMAAGWATDTEIRTAMAMDEWRHKHAVFAARMAARFEPAQ